MRFSRPACASPPGFFSEMVRTSDRSSVASTFSVRLPGAAIRRPPSFAAPSGGLDRRYGPYTLPEEILMRSHVHRWFAVFALLIAVPGFGSTRIETLQTASAHKFSAYVDGPKDAGVGIVLVHD